MSSTERASLYAQAAVDVASALCSSMIVSPFILTIDKAIVEAAAGHRTLWSAIVSGTSHIVRRPNKALLANPAYWMITGVYAVTYTAANLIDSAASYMSASPTVHGAAKLFGTTAINTTACIAKDVAFARRFGAVQGGPMPLVTVGLFGARDLLTMGSAFTVPPVLASALHSGGVARRTADDAAQIISPISLQVVCAPIHLLGLNFYNAPVATAAERFAAVARTAPQTTIAYAIRMAPAFGIGGVMNTTLTTNGHEAVRRHFSSSTALDVRADCAPVAMAHLALKRIPTAH